MQLEDLKALPTCAWNESTAPVAKDWLKPALTPGEVERLKACGNLVMPAVANAAAHLLGHVV